MSVKDWELGCKDSGSCGKEIHGGKGVVLTDHSG